MTYSSDRWISLVAGLTRVRQFVLTVHKRKANAESWGSASPGQRPLDKWGRIFRRLNSRGSLSLSLAIDGDAGGAAKTDYY